MLPSDFFEPGRLIAQRIAEVVEGLAVVQMAGDLAKLSDGTLDTPAVHVLYSRSTPQAASSSGAVQILAQTYMVIVVVDATTEPIFQREGDLVTESLAGQLLTRIYQALAGHMLDGKPDGQGKLRRQNYAPLVWVPGENTEYIGPYAMFALSFEVGMGTQ